MAKITVTVDSVSVEYASLPRMVDVELDGIEISDFLNEFDLSDVLDEVDNDELVKYLNENGYNIDE